MSYQMNESYSHLLDFLASMIAELLISPSNLTYFGLPIMLYDSHMTKFIPIQGAITTEKSGFNNSSITYYNF